MRVGGQSKCGTVGEKCTNLDQLPVCDQQDRVDKWLGTLPFYAVDELVDPKTREIRTEYRSMKDEEALKLPMASFRMNRLMMPRQAQLEEVNHLLTPKKGEKDELAISWLEETGLEGFCRSKDPVSRRRKEYKLYTFKKRIPYDDFITLHNVVGETQNTLRQFYEAGGIQLGWLEMKALMDCKELNLTEFDVVIRAGNLPQEKGPKEYTSGHYLFVRDATRLQQMIDVLEKKEKDNRFFLSRWFGSEDEIPYAVKIPGLKDPDGKDTRRKALIDHLKEVRSEITVMQDNLESQDFKSTISTVFTGAFIFLVGSAPTIALYKWLRNRRLADSTDMREYIEKRLDANKDWHVKGLGDKAKEVWEHTFDPDFRHVVIEGGTGSGKDILVEEVIRQLITGEATVPEGFKDAKVKIITPADMGKGTKYRGVPADKVKAVADIAKKRPVILVLKEIDLIMASGKAESDPNSISSLLLAELEDETVKKNLIIFGTTARGTELRLEADNFIRRAHWVEKQVDPLSLVIENLDGPRTRMFERFFDVSIPRSAIEDAARLAEQLVRPASIKIDPKTGRETLPYPRYFAVEEVLKNAARLANKEGASEVERKHVKEATEKLCERSFSAKELAEIDIMLETDADKLMKYDLEGTDKASVQAASATPTTNGIRAVADQIVENQMRAAEEAVRKMLGQDTTADAQIQDEGARAFAEGLLEEQARQDPMLRVALRNRTPADSAIPGSRASAMPGSAASGVGAGDSSRPGASLESSQAGASARRAPPRRSRSRRDADTDRSRSAKDESRDRSSTKAASRRDMPPFPRDTSDVLGPRGRRGK